MTLNNIHKIFISPKIFSFMKTPNILKFKILNQKIARAYKMYVCMNISEYPPPLGGKQTDRPKLLLKSEISNISFCLAPLIKVHANCYYQIKGHFRLIRHMCPDFNRLFDLNCKIDILQIQSNLDYSKCQGPHESFRIIGSSNDRKREFSDIFGKARTFHRTSLFCQSSQLQLVFSVK